MPKYANVVWIFRIIGAMAKTLYGYWSGHPCSVGIAGPNIARVSIIDRQSLYLPLKRPQMRSAAYKQKLYMQFVFLSSKRD